MKKIIFVFVYCGLALAAFGQQTELLLNNDVLTVKFDLIRGGAIKYISLASSTRNLVNIHDEGRYIQQSYYAGSPLNRRAEGQASSWSPWPWNPIQVGDTYGHRAQILAYTQNQDTVYVRCIPMLWDMNNEPAEAIMEQWTVLDENVIHVRNKLTCKRTDSRWEENAWCDQELPAVYPISALKNLYTYTGDTPFSMAPVEKHNVINLSSGFWGIYHTATEHWMAFVDYNGWGMGVYNHLCLKFLAGMAGNPGYEARDGSTSYIAPVKRAALNKDSIYEYTYSIIIGTVAEIRARVYDLDALHIDPPVPDRWDFDDGNDLQGWIPNGALRGQVNNGIYELTVIHGDPYLTQQADVYLKASDYDQLVVRMKNKTSDTSADFFFKSTAHPDTYNRIRFYLQPNDSEFREYKVDLSSASEWQDTIFFIRLDPVSDVDNGELEIDYIALAKSATHVKAGQNKAMPLELMQNYPNPFNASTTVSFRLESRDWVRLYVTNLHGQIVQTLVDGTLDSGRHQVQWDGTNQMQNIVSSGIYIINLIASDKRETTRVLYLK